MSDIRRKALLDNKRVFKKNPGDDGQIPNGQSENEGMQTVPWSVYRSSFICQYSGALWTEVVTSMKQE